MSLTPEQLEARRKGLGGSEIAAVLGESRFATPFDVWLSKTQGWVQPETEDMRRGTFLEAGIADWYAQRYELKGGDLSGSPTQKHATQPVAMCTPDRIVFGTKSARLVSIKAPRRKSDEWGEPGTDAVPPAYALQLQWEHLVCSSHFPVDDEMHLAALLDGDLAVYVVRADVELQRWMLDYAVNWWARHVVTGVAPPMDGSSQAGAWLKSKYPRDAGVKREATLSETSAMVALEQCEENLDYAERRVESLKSQLKLSMGDATCITAPCGTVTWKVDKNGKRSFKTNWRKE